jgi:hypothetical protein
MAWTERMAAVQIGDTVAYSKQFLQSTWQYTGDAPLARGKITGLATLGDTVLAEVEWDRGELPGKLNVRNLSRVKDGVVVDRD